MSTREDRIDVSGSAGQSISERSRSGMGQADRNRQIVTYDTVMPSRSGSRGSHVVRIRKVRVALRVSVSGEETRRQGKQVADALPFNDSTAEQYCLPLP